MLKTVANVQCHFFIQYFTQVIHILPTNNAVAIQYLCQCTDFMDTVRLMLKEGVHGLHVKSIPVFVL